jgi:pyruvate dehydrogenase E2 component (dihydrolipoamide acetyltransferase)
VLHPATPACTVLAGTPTIHHSERTDAAAAETSFSFQDEPEISVEFKLPSPGEGVESADVAEVLVAEGDSVAEGQPLLELETEKAVMEVPSPAAGKIGKVHVSEGDTIKVGQLLFTIDTNGAAPAEQKPSQGAAASKSKDGAKPAKSETPSAAAKKPEKKEPQPAAKGSKGKEGSGAGAAAGGSGGTFEFKLPSLGEGVTKADVAEVLVKVGDVIEAEQPVLELETEKAVMEVPCPQGGTIESLQVKAGDSVGVGQTVLTLRTVSAVSPPAREPKAEAAPAKESASKSQGKPEPAKTEAKPAARGVSEPELQLRPAMPVPKDATASRLEPELDAGDNGQPPVPAAPSTRRLARKLGVNLRDVKGSGPGGRISQEDVEDHVKGLLEQRQLPAVSRRGEGTLIGGSLAPPPLPDFSRFGLVEREKLSKIARTAAENLTVSWNVIPHVTQHDRADITELEEARKRFGQGVGKNGPKVTMTAVAIKALAKCLQIYPKFNSSLDPETNELVFKKFYNIGCAVDTPYGLLVPVVKECDRKSILQIAADITDLAEKARDRKLPLDTMQGATCTVTNLGGIGGTAFTPIVNYPEVCILGMARSQKELQLADGKVVERLMLPLALSYDHRVINGADAARFMATLCQMLSDPFQLLSAI